MRAHVALMIMTLVPVSMGCDAATAPPEPDPGEAANRVLYDLQEVEQERVYRSLGFQSESEVARAESTSPLRVYTIRLDALRDYKGGGSDMMTDTGTALSIVLVDGQPRTTVTLKEESGAWTTVRVGGGERAVLLDRSLTALLGERQIDRAQAFIVQVPALGLEFVGYSHSGGVRLAPISDAEELGLRAGRVRSLDDVLVSLVPAAKAYKEVRPESTE